MNRTFKHLRVHLGDDAVLRVILDRADIFNALNDEMVEELHALFVDLYWRIDIRVVLLSANGRHFCAGLDMSERRGRADPSVDGSLVAQRRISEIVIAMRRCPQPIIALVNGAASGGGFAIALAADVRVATPDTRMNAAFIRIGLSGCDIGVSYFLPRMVGSAIAAEYLLTGRFMDADRAYGLGLVSSIVAHDVLTETGEALVADMLGASPLGLRLTKEALNHAVDAGGLEAVIAMEDRNQILCTQSDDFLEGLAAFREKRRPQFGRGTSPNSKG